MRRVRDQRQFRCFAFSGLSRSIFRNRDLTSTYRRELLSECMKSPVIAQPESWTGALLVDLLREAQAHGARIAPPFLTAARGYFTGL